MIAGQLEILMFANIARLSDDMRRAERVVSDNMGKVERSVASAKQAMQSLGMGLSIGVIANTLRGISDAYTKLDAQLRLSTKSQQSYNQALADIRSISQVAQADISATSMLYTRMMNTMEGTGVSQRKLATVTETITFGLKAYGATSAEAASASLQLSQAMGANRLGGEEFRAVMEAMPNVMKVLATSMGVSIGELRSLSIAGKITAAEMIKAWGNPEIAAQFRKYAENAQTITGAMTNVRNELLLLVGEFAKSSGITGGTVAAFNALAEGVRITARYTQELVNIVGIYVSVKIASFVYQYVTAMVAQRVATLAVAQAEMEKINMTYGATAASRVAAASALTQATANMTLVGSLRAATLAMRTFLLTNPIGWITLALTVGITVWQEWGKAAEENINKVSARTSEAIAAMTRWNGIIAANRAAAAKLHEEWTKFHATPAEQKAQEVAKLNTMYADLLKLEGGNLKAREKLAREYKIKYDDIMAGKGRGTSEANPMERMRIDLAATNEADVSGRMSNVEKVQAVWDKYTEHRVITEEMLKDKEAALIQARIADWHKLRDAIASDITSGIISGFENGASASKILEDVSKKLVKDFVLEPQIKLAVTAGVDWVKVMIANTIATEKNTAVSGATSGTGSLGMGQIAVIIAALALLFRMSEVRKVADITQLSATNRGVTGRSGAIFEVGLGGMQATEWGRLGTTQLNKFNSVAKDSIATYASLGDVIGMTNIRNEKFSVTLTTSGDAVAELTKSIGSELIPGLRMLQREGESLTETAKRITETFKATNDFITALGVSQNAAFGGFGLASAAGRDVLIAASGGLQQFTSNAQGFVKNFLTPAQQLAPALDSVGRTFARLGIEGVNTNEQFAALVKQQMELGNTEVVAQLLSVSDSFNTITKSASEANRQINALFSKDKFATLVDYNRALGLAGSSAVTSISSATTIAKVQIAQETTGTSAFTAGGFVSPISPKDLSQSGGSVFLNMIKEVIGAIWDGFKNLLSFLWDGFMNLLSSVWDGFVNVTSSIWGGFKNLLSFLWDGFANLLSFLWDGFKNMINGLVDVIISLPSKLWEAIKNAFSFGGGGTVGGIVKSVGGFIGGVANAASDIIGGIGNIFGFANGGVFGSTGVHAFANGGTFTNGIFSSATPFMFADGGGFSPGVMGEAGSEAVMPLSRKNGRLGVRMDGGGGSNAALLEEIQGLRADLRASQGAIALSSEKSRKILDKFDKQGLPAERVI